MIRGSSPRRRTELSPAVIVQIAVVLVLIGFMIHAARHVPRPSEPEPAVYEGETGSGIADRRPLPGWVLEMLDEGALSPDFFENPARAAPAGGKRIDYYFYPEDPRGLDDIMIVACDKPGTYDAGGNLLFKDGTVVFWRPEGGADAYARLARAVLNGNRNALVQAAIRIRAEVSSETAK